MENRSLENIAHQIAELERTLLLKKAYLAAHISFGKGAKAFPDDIRKEVTDNLLRHASMLADGSAVQTPSAESEFNESEIKALKSLAQTILDKRLAGANGFTRVPKEPVEPAVANVSKPLTATLLLLDSLPVSMRKRVDSGSTVRIMDEREDKFFVQDSKANRFWISKEDVEIQP